jgi:hypothetical protein
MDMILIFHIINALIIFAKALFEKFKLNFPNEDAIKIFYHYLKTEKIRFFSK